ncbi:MAG: DUF58 domain-containing protein [Candidatus Hydrogenedentota bacterium]|nr:MAG: DUF58 domain-containing protein [Candidatus Hydrogenedentota bacterium]
MEKVRFEEIVPTLKSLSIAFQKRSDSFLYGAHRGKKKGYDDEFTELREYAAGDDLRYLDWKVWAKTEKLTIRHGFQQARFSVLILLDLSASTNVYPEKKDTMRLAALGLSWLFFHASDKVNFVYSNGEDVKDFSLKKKHEFFLLDSELTQTRFPKTKKTGCADIFTQYIEQNQRKTDVIFWFTDLYEPTNHFKKLVSTCREKNIFLSVIHATAGEEWKLPPLRFLSRATDSETENWFSAEMLPDYKTVWEEAVSARAKIVTSYGFRFIKFFTTDGPFRFLHQLTYLR